MYNIGVLLESSIFKWGSEPTVNVSIFRRMKNGIMNVAYLDLELFIERDLLVI